MNFLRALISIMVIVFLDSLMTLDALGVGLVDSNRVLAALMELVKLDFCRDPSDNVVTGDFIGNCMELI